MNEINEMRLALQQVNQNQQYLSEGKIADQMRANLKKRKKDWDEKSDGAKKDAYKALDHAKKTQADLEKSDFIQNVGEDYVAYIASRLRYHLNR